MKHRGLLSLALVAAFSVAAHAADVTRSVPARLSFAPSASMSVQVRNIADNAATDTITFAYTGTQPHVLSSQYISLAYASNYSNWKINTYTANRATRDPNNANWGALVGSDTNNRIPLMWHAYPDTIAGGPTWNGTAADTWMYFKDTGDSDFATIGGYITVVYGSGNSWSNIYYGVPEVTPTAFYIGAITSAVVPDEYATAIRFDLLHL